MCGSQDASQLKRTASHLQGEMRARFLSPVCSCSRSHELRHLASEPRDAYVPKDVFSSISSPKQMRQARSMGLMDCLLCLLGHEECLLPGVRLTWSLRNAEPYKRDLRLFASCLEPKLPSIERDAHSKSPAIASFLPQYSAKFTWPVSFAWASASFSPLRPV